MTTFFAVSAGAAATLVGLLFVAVQIVPPLVSSGPIGRRHAMARSTFTIFGVIFGLSLYFLAPGASLKARATAAIIASAAGSIRAVRTWLPVWQDKLEGRIEFRLWQTAWLLLGPVLAYAYLIARATASGSCFASDSGEFSRSFHPRAFKAFKSGSAARAPGPMAANASAAKTRR